MTSMPRAGRRGWQGAGRTTGLALSALLALTLAAPVSPAGAVRAPAARADRDPTLRDAGDPLPRAARGTRAVDRLGDRLPEVARLNGLSRTGLATLLEEDSSAWVAADGRVFFRDPGPSDAEVAATPEPEASAAAPLAETFRLHSRPDAERKILLDVDGAVVAGTAWNDEDGIGTSHPAWDPAGDGDAFNDAELARVQAVWQMVSADFAAFDVDVTTEDPGADGLSRASSDDTAYGAHVLITPSDDAWNGICGRGCGGVAYLRTFGEVDGGTPYRQPAWVFADGVGDSVKGVAEAASHEVGHQLGLDHDGVQGGSSYYGGHGAWGPIMGASYQKPISQWSRGEYANADNQQDDLSVIAGRIPRVPDEAGGSVAGAAPLPAGTAYVTSRTDVDTYALGECAGQVSATATTAGLGPDLDVQLSLLDADGSVVGSADPTSAGVDASRASGMDASLSASVPAGTYHLGVEGVGNGTPIAGYDDYASIGGYEISVAGCDGASPTGAPSAPLDVVATPDAVEPTVTLTWAAPEDGGSSDITGYTVTRSGSASPVALPAGARSHTLTGLQAGTDYTLTVQAQNASGAGPSATVTATTAAAPVQAPSAPRAFAAVYDTDSSELRLSWTPPGDDGGSAITGYDISLDGTLLTSVGATSRSAVGTGWNPGTYRFEIRARNAAGAGATATATVTVPAPLTTTTWTRRSVSGRTVTLSAVVRLVDGDVDGHGPPTGAVTFHEGGVGLGGGALQPLDGDRAIARVVLSDVAPGQHAYRGAYSPDDASRLAPSADAAWPVRVERMVSRTAVRAPRRARAGTRPVVRVRVDGGPARARGRVQLVVRALHGRTAHRAVTPRLRGETVSFRLPRLRPGRVRVVARYRGSALHLPSRGGRAIRVVRR